jgi:hypothetical protein
MLSHSFSFRHIKKDLYYFSDGGGGGGMRCEMKREIMLMHNMKKE